MPEHMIAVNGASLHVTESGSGPPLLLLSGGPGLTDYLGSVAERIADLVTVYRMEPRGCGRSTIDGPYDVDTTLADLDDVRDALGISRWIVAGHSHGAFYALAYALAFPDRVDAIIHMAGVGLQSDRSWSAAYHAGKDAGLGNEVPEEFWEYRPEVNEAGNASFKEYVRRPTLWREVANLDVPLLAIYGELDIRPMWPVEQLVALMPNARLEVIPAAPHDFWYTHPDALSAILRPFIAKHIAII